MKAPEKTPLSVALVTILLLRQKKAVGSRFLSGNIQKKRTELFRYVSRRNM